MAPKEGLDHPLQTLINVRTLQTYHRKLRDPTPGGAPLESRLFERPFMTSCCAHCDTGHPELCLACGCEPLCLACGVLKSKRMHVDDASWYPVCAFSGGKPSVEGRPAGNLQSVVIGTRLSPVIFVDNLFWVAFFPLCTCPPGVSPLLVTTAVLLD